MNKQLTLITLLAIVLITAISLTSLRARDATPPNWSTIERNYATANLELAKSRLALAESQRQAVADSVSEETLDALQAGVRFAQDRLAHLSNRDAANPFAPQIATATDQLKGLEADHAKSLEANRLAAGAVSDLKLRNEVAEINLAKARLAAMQSMAQQPLEVRIQWQIALLQDEIRALWARPHIED